MTNAAASGTEEVVGGGLTLFGFTFTSKVLGIVMGIGGIGLAIYMATNYVTPLWDQVQSGQTNIATKKTAVTDLEQKITSKGNVLVKIEEAKR
jgi:type IV pilus assembly protein PilO